MKDFHVIINKGEDEHLIAEVIELPECHTQAKDLNTLIGRIEEAIKTHLKNKKEITPMPKPIGFYRITI